MRTRKSDGARILTLTLVGAGSLALAALVIKISAVRAFPVQTGIGAAIAPNDPDLLFKSVGAGLSTPDSKIGRETLQQVASAAGRDPLSAEPFYIFALKALSDGDGERALPLLEEARRRNPRHTRARLLLIDRYFRSARIADATEEISVVSRLAPAAWGLLVSMLAKLAEDPTAHEPVRRALKGDPLLERVLERLVADRADTNVILRLAGRQPRPVNGKMAEWQRLLVSSLVASRETQRAHTLWTEFTGVDAQRWRDTIYDPDFNGLRGSPPFNWALSENEIGSADPQKDGSLEVDYFGRVSGELASQLLMLSPGRYQLSFNSEGEARGQGSRLAWRIQCQGAKAPLVDLALLSASSAPKKFASSFTVPSSNCPSQWLRLEGLPAEFPTAQSVRISGLRLRRVAQPS